MPSTDRGGRGYSDKYIEEIEERLYLARKQHLPNGTYQRA
jgi:hypothetical protein